MSTSTGKTVFAPTIPAFLAVALLVLSVQPVMAASQARFANGATFVLDTQWVPFPSDPLRVSGPSDSLCVAAGDQPGGAYIQLTFAAFTIPAGNIIQGIEVKLDYETVGENDVQLHDSGTLIGTVGTMPSADGANTCDGTSWTTAGTPTDMWGASLSIADFNAGNIGFRMTQPIVPGGGGDPGSRTVDIDAAELVVYYGAANTAPTANAGGPYSVDEGGSEALSGAGSSDPEQSTGTLTFDWDLDNNGSYETSGMSPNFSAVGLDGPDSKVVGLRVTDNGALTDTDTATVNITNVAPTVATVTASPEPSNEAVAVTASATYSDPGTPDNHTCTVDYGDGSGALIGTASGGTCTGPSHIYVDDNPTGTPSDSYVVTVAVTDDDGGSDSNDGSHTVNNVAPTVGAVSVSPEPSDEGAAVTASATYTDPGTADTHTCTVDYGDGSGALGGTAVGGTCTGPSHTYVDDDPTGTPSDSYTVTVAVTDDDGGSDSSIGSHTVNNVAPSIDSINLNSSSIDEGQSVTVSGTYSDPALSAVTETFSGTAVWSDGPSTLLTVNTDGTFETSRTFPDDHPATGTASDLFTVDITITDDDTGSDTGTSPVLTVNNVDPSIDSITLSVSSINEGDPAGVMVSGTYSDPALGVVTETFSGTAVWSDGPSTLLTVNADGTFETSRTFPDDDPLTGTLSDIFTVDITITDDDTGSDTDTSPNLTVDNVDPTITATTNSAEECGDTPEGTPVEVTANFSDPGFGPTEDFAASTIDWGDGFSEPATVDVTPGGFGTPTTGAVSGSHVYASGGIFTIHITVTDDDTGSASTTLTALVTGAGLTPAGLLGVVGTDYLDVASIQVKHRTDIVVMAGFLGPGKANFPAVDVVSIEVQVCDGNDQIHVNKDITKPAVLDGGPGPDHVRAGSGDSMVLGGTGNDTLFAGKYGSMLDGGLGDDDLNGNKGNDILLGGEGDDKLAGDKGDDVLDGGPGVDDCNEGQGTDIVTNCEM